MSMKAKWKMMGLGPVFRTFVWTFEVEAVHRLCCTEDFPLDVLLHGVYMNPIIENRLLFDCLHFSNMKFVNDVEIQTRGVHWQKS